MYRLFLEINVDVYSGLSVKSPRVRPVKVTIITWMMQHT